MAASRIVALTLEELALLCDIISKANPSIKDEAILVTLYGKLKRAIEDPKT